MTFRSTRRRVLYYQVNPHWLYLCLSPCRSSAVKTARPLTCISSSVSYYSCSIACCQLQSYRYWHSIYRFIQWITNLGHHWKIRLKPPKTPMLKTAGGKEIEFDGNNKRVQLIRGVVKPIIKE